MEYIVKEYFCIENTLKLEGTVEKIVHRFAKLGGLMLNGWAEVQRLWINADGVEYEFLGNTVTEDYHKIVQAIGSANSLEFVAEYRYKSEYYTEIFLFASEIAEHLDDLIQKNKTEIPDGLFYATYNAVADYISDNEMFAYGKKDNRTYNGEVTNEDAEYLLSLIEEMCEK